MGKLMEPDTIISLVTLGLTLISGTAALAFTLTTYISRGFARVHERFDQQDAATAGVSERVARVEERQSELRRDFDLHATQDCHTGRGPACES
jgi:hypothetical protein